MRGRLRLTAVLAIAAGTLAGTAGPAGSAAYDIRTERMSAGAGGSDLNAGSTRPSVSADGSFVAFDSVATNIAPDPNGAIRDVFLRDVKRGSTVMMSIQPSGEGANGPSYNATVAPRAPIVVFESDASNLVPGDTNGVTDVFVAYEGKVDRVSVGAGGEQANGVSTAADISADGRVVVFSSTATNLDPRDRNARPDVFVHDRRTGTTRILSFRAGLVMDGDSTLPSISPDGNWVSFTSTNTNLVLDDGNRVADVILADIRRGTLQRVSVSTFGEEQNRSVAAPFVQTSDVSRDGRYVAFDSDATNLVNLDRNRDTDVFVHDRRKGMTTRVSLDVFAREGINDSFFPRISGDGRYVAFQSFAGNLSDFDNAREDVFVYDRERFAPSLVSVGARGQRRANELVRQLLQRPSISDRAAFVAFTSTAPNLVGGDKNGVEDVFLRRMAAPRARIGSRPRRIERTRRVRYTLRADDKRATFLCIIDNRFRFPCRSRGRLPALRPGRHSLQVRGTGPGMLVQDGVVKRRRFTIVR